MRASPQSCTPGTWCWVRLWRSVGERLCSWEILVATSAQRVRRILRSGSGQNGDRKRGHLGM